MRVLPPLPPQLSKANINTRDLKQYLVEVEDAMKDTLVGAPEVDNIRQLQGMILVVRELRTKLHV